jgi:ferredoxin
MKAKVDAELCVACEACCDLCPEVFEMGEEVAVVKVDEVPPEHADAVREAAEACPTEAISIEG